MSSFGLKIFKRSFSSSSKTATELVSTAKLVAGANASASHIWKILSNELLSPSLPFEVHKKSYEKVYDEIDADIRPAWFPSKEVVEKTNIYKMMMKKGFSNYQQFYKWSIDADSRDDFWMESFKNINIEWEKEPTGAFDMTAGGGGSANITYFPEGRLNISDSCFNKRDPLEPALIYSMETDGRNLREMSFKTLDCLSNQIANGITNNLNLKPGDSIGACMPMTPESIAIYLGIVKAGCVVVSIADSFSSDEIATRCRISNAKAIFTQDVIFRGAKFIPLFDRVIDADQIVQKSHRETMGDDSSLECSMKIVVLPGMLHANSYPDVSKDQNGSTWTNKNSHRNQVPLHESIISSMRNDQDISWYELLHNCSEEYTSVKRNAMEPCNIVFSSGTTGEPKAIVLSHSTPIKVCVRT
jgi:acetyl-CoA synthetase